MKSSRQRITLLQNRIKETIPDEQGDLYGFQGVTRSLILESLIESYDLLNALEAFEGKLEAVLLERRIAELFEKANGQLKDRGFEKRLEEFNSFLNTLTKIRFLIKQSYITLAKDPIRTETEIKKAKDELISLSTTLAEIKNVTDEIDEMRKATQDVVNDLGGRQRRSIEDQKKIEEFLNKNENLDTRATEVSENIETYNQEIEETRESIKTNESTISRLAKEIAEQKDKNLENANKITAELERAGDVGAKNAEQQTEIQKTIEDANRLGMAGAFKKRKDELRLPLLFWTSVSIVTLIGLVALSYSIMKDILTNNVEIYQLYLEIPIFASSVWLGWFSARQFGYVARIREDYSYKYAISMAFEGYKNATREIDTEMLKELLKLTIYNMSKNPIEIYDSKNNHGTPYTEIVEKLFGPRKA